MTRKLLAGAALLAASLEGCSGTAPPPPAPAPVITAPPPPVPPRAGARGKSGAPATRSRVTADS